MKTSYNIPRCGSGNNRILAIAFSLCLLASCQQKYNRIMTVQGYIAADSMGVTLAHEHVMVDFIGADSTGYERWNRDTVIAKVLPYLLEAKKAGVRTIIECTPAYLGRDPILLQMLSERSGIQFITNTGYYGAADNKAIPSHAYDETVEQIAERWINEWKNGIEFTGIRPGFIKIAVPGDSVLSEIHQKLVRAAAQTHLKTGLVINAHTGPAAPAFAELAILKEERVDPSAFIWTHAQRASHEDQVKAASMGAWISLDNVSETSIDEYVSALVNLKAHGLLNKALISHDAGWYDVVHPASIAYRGYTTIFTHLKPALIKAGFTEKDFDLLLVTNPKSAYTIAVRRLKK